MKTNTGFTLIEVLIAMLVLAIGLLGLAALQTYTLRSNLAAYNHGQATQLLYDMADRMRANNCKASPTATPPVTCPTAANYIIANTSTDNRTAGVTVSSSHACKTVGNTTCTALLLSTYDLIEWNNAIAATLPMGRGCIAAGNGAGIFNLYITWDDDRSGVVTTDVAVPTGCATFTDTAASGTTADPVFTMSLQP
ncbi:MAG: type IV pilus modification protein PilV [Methylococcales bacterium]|nr:type IV pilus modification protein PilV [Methylococcales bacterium]